MRIHCLPYWIEAHLSNKSFVLYLQFTPFFPAADPTLAVWSRFVKITLSRWFSYPHDGSNVLHKYFTRNKKKSNSMHGARPTFPYLKICLFLFLVELNRFATQINCISSHMIYSCYCQYTLHFAVRDGVPPTKKHQKRKKQKWIRVGLHFGSTLASGIVSICTQSCLVTATKYKISCSLAQPSNQHRFVPDGSAIHVVNRYSRVSKKQTTFMSIVIGQLT